MLIPNERSIIPACDVTARHYEDLVKATAEVEGISAYKVGFVLALSIGLPKAVAIARKYTNKPIIYDHQKAGTDIPDTGKRFMKVCSDAEINSVILFPQAGPETERAWIEAAKEYNLEVIVGGLMTHKAFNQSDGGWIRDDAVEEIYLNAAALGVDQFVVPGTKPEAIQKIRTLLEAEGVKPTFYSPGIGAQGGDIQAGLEATGGRWHPIVGRAIYEAEDMAKAAQDLIDELNKY